MTQFHILCLTCDRDWPMAQMMLDSARRFPFIGSTVVFAEERDAAVRPSTKHWVGRRPDGFGQWGWPGTMIKFGCIRASAIFPRRGDYLVCVDSDVFFGSEAAFRFVHETKPPIAGMPHDIPSPTPYGDFKHYSGACMFLRADVVEYIASLTDEDFSRIEQEMRAANLCVNEDVAVSYAVWRGPFGPGMAINGTLWESPDMAGLLNGVKPAGSVIHYNVNNKFDFPKRLKEKGAYPPW